MRAAAVIAIALFASCSSDEPPATTPTATVRGTPEPTLDPPEASLDAELKDGAVVGGIKNKSIALGETVGIAVRSDVADTVVVEGEPRTSDVTAGGGIYVSFEPKERGTFTVRMEKAGVTLAEIEVT